MSDDASLRPALPQRALGRAGPTVAALGLGAMSFAGAYGPTDEAEAHATLARALDLGVTHIDTARIYGEGRSEEIIGSFLRKTRARFTIATKGGIVTAPQRGFDNSPEYLRDCLEGSLRRLGVDHVELYYIHRRDPRVPVEDVMETLLRFRDEGKIGGIGFSEIAPSTLERALACAPVMAVQSEYSLWTRQPELGMLQACRRHGVAFVAFSPVARGALTDTPPDPAGFAERDFRKPMPRFSAENWPRNRAAIEPLRAFARERGWSLAGLAIAWVLAQGEQVHAIPGTRTSAHLDELAAGAAVALSAEDLAEIEAILPAGFAHGPRYSETQRIGAEDYC